MRIYKVIGMISVLLMSGFTATSANAAHRHFTDARIFKAAQKFEQAAWRMHQVLRRHGNHYGYFGVKHKAANLASEAQRLRRVVARGAPEWRIRKQLANVSREFLQFRHEYRHFRASHKNRRIARSYRQLRFAHEHLNNSARWGRERPHEWSTLHFSLSF